MSKHPLRIVTDSTADIPTQVAHRLDITVIPCQIHFGGTTYRDGIDITRQELYRRMRDSQMFTTSQPSVGVFAEAYSQALEGDGRVIAIHLGSTLSGLYNTACLGAREVDPERVTVVDTQQASMCAGWVAIHAAEMAQRGCSADEILGALREMIPHLRLYALIDDLRFMQRGGRVSAITSLVGQLLAIKPIILVEHGHAGLSEKTRSLSRGLDRLAALAAAQGTLERLAILHADAPATAARLHEQVAHLVSSEHCLITEAGAVISAHAGPGAVGLACVARR